MEKRYDEDLKLYEKKKPASRKLTFMGMLSDRLKNVPLCHKPIGTGMGQVPVTRRPAAVLAMVHETPLGDRAQPDPAQGTAIDPRPAEDQERAHLTRSIHPANSAEA